MADITKKVFVSYSWQVQERVIELAERLIANGVDVVIDIYELKEGQDKYAFMEQSVNDSSIDKVLIICDKSYTEKANNRSGGVGDETVIISPEMYGQIRQEKFVPIIFEVDESGKVFCPHYIKSRIYIDLSTDDDRYETEYEKLLRNIYEKPLYKITAIGEKPEWLENDTIDLSAIRDLIKQVRGYAGGSPTKAEFLLRKATDQFIETARLFVLPEGQPNDEALLTIIDQTKSYKDLFIDYTEALIYSSMPISKTLTSLYERLFNELHDKTGKTSYSKSDFELYDFMIWEIFINIAATLIHFERFQDLHDIVTHTYFLKENYFSNTLKPYTFAKFRPYCHTLEETCKCRESLHRLSRSFCYVQLGFIPYNNMALHRVSPKMGYYPV